LEGEPEVLHFFLIPQELVANNFLRSFGSDNSTFFHRPIAHILCVPSGKVLPVKENFFSLKKRDKREKEKEPFYQE